MTPLYLDCNQYKAFVSSGNCCCHLGKKEQYDQLLKEQYDQLLAELALRCDHKKRTCVHLCAELRHELREGCVAITIA